MSEPSGPPATKRTTLDHVAIGVRQWSDSYDRFVHQLGGRWAIGGPSGDFAPYQLYFGSGMRLEFIAPNAETGFMHRFLDRYGPSPHHVTFKVASLSATVRELEQLGLATFADRPDLPAFRELFVHPRHTGLGTLLQLVESDEDIIARAAALGPARPPDFPVPTVAATELALFGLTVPDLQQAHDLLVTVLDGTVTDKADGWFFLTWGPGRSIIVRHPDTAPCDARLWLDVPRQGVGFVLFGPAALTAADLRERTGEAVLLPPHPATGIPVWLLNTER